MSETEKTPASDVPTPPVEDVTLATGSAEPVEISPNASVPEDLPEWEPLTPDIVEDEAIRGDFMLRWAVVLLALLIGCRQIVETNTLVQVKTGQMLAARGFWPPANDVLSSSASAHRWVNLHWLWDLISSGLFAVGEGIGLSLATALLVAATWWLLGKTSRAGISTWWGSIVGALTLLACHLQFSGRPETITLLGLAATMWWLQTWRASNEVASERPVSLWWLVPGFVLWSNLDNRMFLGWMLLVLWGAGEFLGQSLGRARLTVTQRGLFWRVLGTAVVASCLNPFGAQALRSPLALFGTEYPAWKPYVSPVSGLAEAGGYSLLNAELWRLSSDRLPLLAGVLVLVAALVTLILNRRRADLGDVLCLAGFTGLAALAAHELAAASLVAAAIATLNAQQWYQSSFRQAYSIEPKELLFTRGGRAVTVLAFFLLAVMAINQSLFGVNGKRVGVGLSPRLRNMVEAYREATANTFDDRPFNFVPSQGDVLIWVGKKPFLDSRLSVFAGHGELDLLSLHDQARRSLAGLDDQPAEADSNSQPLKLVRESVDWQLLFDRFELTHAMPRLFGGNPTAYFRMLMNPNWRLTYFGAHCAVFHRSDSASPELKQFREEHPHSFLKAAFQTKEPHPLRTDWPRPRTTFQKFLSPPAMIASNKVLEAENLLMHLRGLMSGQISIEQPTAVALAHLAIRKANAALVDSADEALAYQHLGEAYSFLMTVESSIGQSGGVQFQNPLRFYQALGAFHQAIKLEPRSLALREHLLNLLMKQNRIDLILRELQVIEELAANSSSVESDELEQRHLTLREKCASQRDAMTEQINSLLDQGQSGATLAPNVYASGFVLEAMRLLRSDPNELRQSADLQSLEGLLRFEAGEIEEAYQQFEFGAETNQSAWQIPAAWTRLAHGEHDKAIELWTQQGRMIQETTLTGLMTTLPMVQSPYHMLGHPNVWPTQHHLMYSESQMRTSGELEMLLWYTAMCQIESGNPSVASKTISGLLDLNPETPFRPLARFYRFVLDEELLDIEPPSEWIPIDGELFLPDESNAAEKK